MEDILQKLKNALLFNKLTDDELKKLKDMGQRIKLKNNEIVFMENDISRDIYIILEGTIEIKISVNPDDDDKTELSYDIVTLQAGDFLGTFAFIDSKPRSATASVHSDSAVLLKLPFEALNDLLESNTDLGYKFYKNLCNNLCCHIRQSDLSLKTMVDYNL